VRRALVEGHDAAFNVIAAAGPHATTLHWVRNDGQLRRGDVLLLDAGVEIESHYVSDLTRTYPLGGTYTPLQSDLLELLNDAHEAALDAIAPGRSFRDFRTASAAVLGEGLAARGLLPAGVAPDEAQRRFSICGPGHMLGLDVHDCAHARAATYLDGTLEVGHVLTVEPGLYFQPEDVTLPPELRGLGLRVEDDVVVTPTGCRNLSARLPRRPREVEDWLARLGSAPLR
jgi:Xaa-Pro aminopeptidase